MERASERLVAGRQRTLKESVEQSIDRWRRDGWRYAGMDKAIDGSWIEVFYVRDEPQ